MTNPSFPPGFKGQVLLCDDDSMIRRTYARVLRQAGFEVSIAEDGAAAQALLAVGGFHCVVTDLAMPGMTGIELLRSIRAVNELLPVVLVTGSPSLESAVQAVEHGAVRYLLKPVTPEELLGAVADAIHSRPRTTIDHSELQGRLGRALDSLWMAFQPVFSVTSGKVFAYEALVRTREDSLANPQALFHAAEKLGELQRLGRAIRSAVADRIDEAPGDTRIFVNLHPQELLDDFLYERDSPLTRFSDRVTFEITERAALDNIMNIRSRVFALRNRGYGIAVDDLGSGFAGLATLARLYPDVVKIDRAMARDVHLEPMKQKVIRSIVDLCRQTEIITIAEGIETVEERDTIARLGCTLQQGFLFARPSAAFAQTSDETSGQLSG